jgi:hypothetical protein
MEKANADWGKLNPVLVWSEVKRLWEKRALTEYDCDMAKNSLMNEKINIENGLREYEDITVDWIERKIDEIGDIKAGLRNFYVGSQFIWEAIAEKYRAKVNSRRLYKIMGQWNTALKDNESIGKGDMAAGLCQDYIKELETLLNSDLSDQDRKVALQFMDTCEKFQNEVHEIGWDTIHHSKYTF